MVIENIFSIASAILASIGGGAIIVFALSRWLGGVWAARIIASDKALITQHSEDRTRKIEALMGHYERQIEEFYGPLFNMVHQVFVANHIEYELLNAKRSGAFAIDGYQNRENVKDYYQKNYFIPLHDEIISIMKSKLYLVEGSKVPDSFYLYLKHAAQERDQKSIWDLHGIDSSFLHGEPWPEDFYNDIKKGFETAMENHQQCLNGLKA